jgi:hypothetical protein
VCFSVEKASKTKDAAAWLVNNFVNASHPTLATHYDVVQFICTSAERPIPIVSLHDDLRSIPIIRGYVGFSRPGGLIDQIIRSHDNLEWWITEEGLHVDAVAPISAVPLLSQFDRFAGPLVAAVWKQDPNRKNTFLSDEALEAIAAQLDGAHFELKVVLQPKQWKKLTLHNQKAGRAAIKSFSKLATSMHSQMLRRRLGIARKLYVEAVATEIDPPDQPIPRIFYSVNPILL